MQVLQLLSFVTLAASMSLAIPLPSQEKRLIPPFPEIISSLSTPGPNDGLGALAGGGGKFERRLSTSSIPIVGDLGSEI